MAHQECKQAFQSTAHAASQSSTLTNLIHILDGIGRGVDLKGEKLVWIAMKVGRPGMPRASLKSAVNVGRRHQEAPRHPWNEHQVGNCKEPLDHWRRMEYAKAKTFLLKDLEVKYSNFHFMRQTFRRVIRTTANTFGESREDSVLFICFLHFLRDLH
jgi:hypothetical protein